MLSGEQDLQHLQPSFPIGIFDSGIGGLTVTKAIVEQLPYESIIYFGDTAHLPYGDKSKQVIQNYALRITEMLLQQGCKMILIACNSISAAAYDVIKEKTQGRALLVNVIDPVISYLSQTYQGKTIGLIGTRQTIKSNIYQQKINALHASIRLKSLATPLLVHIIEEGFFNHQLVDVVLEEYLSREILQEIDALILGCTHYPILKDNILQFYKGEVDIIDASPVVALEVKKQLKQHGLLNGFVEDTATKKPINTCNREFYVSDLTDVFSTSAKMFFGDKIKLNHYSLWDNI